MRTSFEFYTGSYRSAVPRRTRVTSSRPVNTGANLVPTPAWRRRSPRRRWRRP